MATAVASVGKKKTAATTKPKSASSHPPFLEMISDAIATLKERTGSSQYAIAKFIEEKHKKLPANFRKNLLVQTKKFVASGKLVKVKASFKLPSAAVKPAAAKPKVVTSTAAAKIKPKTAKTATKPKPKVATPLKAKAKVVGKLKAKAKAKTVAKPTKVAKAAKKSSPGKKVKTLTKKKAVVVVKKPKSLKSPVKKAAPKKAKK